MRNKIIEVLQNKYKQLGLSAKAIEGAAAFFEPSIKEESEIETAIAGVEPLLKALQSDGDAVRTAKTAAEKRVAELEAQVKNFGGTPDKKNEPGKKDGDDDLDAKLQALVDAKVKPLQDKVNAYEAKESASARTDLITSKAKELGIPEWRIKQGFAIAEDADETAIGTALATIKQDIVTAGLGNQTGFPMATPEDRGKELAKEWAAGLPDKQ